MKNSIDKNAITFFVLVFLTVSNQNAFSQTNKFGLSINSLTTNFNYGKENQSLKSYKSNFKGVQIGAYYEMGISQKVSVVPEFYVALKGGVLNEDNMETINKSTLKTWSVEVPILARYHYKNIYFNAGPYVSYIFGGNLKIEANDSSPGKQTKIKFGNSTGEFKHIDAGAQIGAGYNFNLKKSVLSLDVRYGYGLVNISIDIERYNRTFNMSLVLTKTKMSKSKSIN